MRERWRWPDALPTLAAVCVGAWGCQFMTDQDVGHKGRAQSPISNGTDEDPKSEYGRKTVRIVSKTSGKTICTGVVIDKEWIITATHCFSPEAAAWNMNKLKDWVKGHEVRSDAVERTFPIYDAIIKPYVWKKSLNVYRCKLDGPNEFCIDLTLLKIWNDGSTKFGTEDYRAKLPKSATSSYLMPGLEFAIVGYGMNKANDEMSAGTLRRGKAVLKGLDGLEDERFHLGFGANETCPGDSGGGAFTDDPYDGIVVQGILSSGFAWFIDGYRYCGRGAGDIYSNLSHPPIRNWIRTHTKL